MPNLIGQSIGRYHILDQLGEGGMATVYKAFDTRLERNVAIKVILSSKQHSEKFLKRFEREAKALASLSHPNIVGVIDYGEHDGLPYLVMEFVPAGTLKGRLAGAGVSWQEAVRLLIPIARALSYAHDNRIVHRDIKPSNILLTQSGEPMLSDFGIAKILEAEETVDLTGTGVGVGTPEYMSPEQASGKAVDERSDVYSLGVVLYEMVTGRKPYQADTPMAVVWKLASEPLPRPTRFKPGLPDGVERMLLKTLAKNPWDRFQNMSAVVAAMEQLLQGTRWRPSRPWTLSTPKRDGRSLGPSGKSLWSKVLIIVGLGAAGMLAGLAPKYWNAAPVHQSSQTPTPISPSTMVWPADGMVLVHVPEGPFTMGSQNGNVDEKPAREVYLDSYWIDQIEITNAMYAECVKAGACKLPDETSSRTRVLYFSSPRHADYPVLYVSWYQAVDYCKWAGRRLPTEAQWEKAARGLDKRIYPWGDLAPDAMLANFDRRDQGDTSAAGSFPAGASPFAALDMAGNVWEWVLDKYDKTYYQIAPERNPANMSIGDDRVIRGGAWQDGRGLIRTTVRIPLQPYYADDMTGFRCASNESK